MSLSKRWRRKHVRFLVITSQASESAYEYSPRVSGGPAEYLTGWCFATEKSGSCPPLPRVEPTNFLLYDHSSHRFLQASTESELPSHNVYHFREREGGKGFWSQIGAAWAHKDGKGFSVQIETVPLDGRITLRVRILPRGIQLLLSNAGLEIRSIPLAKEDLHNWAVH
jgi:hypothetical protein